MKVIPLGVFLSDLESIARDAKRVVIATYNNLHSYPQGGEFDSGDKKVTILCGGAAFANVEVSLGSYAPNEAAPATKEAGAQTITEGLSAIDSESLVILYAGVSRFDQMSGLAYRLADRGIKVYLVSCGCDDGVFNRLDDHENIGLVAPNGHCNGGRGDLSQIAEKLIK